MSLKMVKVRNIQIGGMAPVSIQSMCNTSPYDPKAILAQIRRLSEAGCEIVRIAIPDMDAAASLKKIRPETDMPLVADIHFDYKLAIAAMEAGADKVRINPGNIGGRERVAEVVKAAKERHIPIRVGVNSGSLEKDIIEKNGGVTPEGLAESALRNLAIIEDMGYDDLVVSIKSSNVKMTYDAHIILAEKTDHPIHIGITEAGTVRQGEIKSAVGLGALLLAGIGDTLRVSLTGDPVNEIYAARAILEAAGKRNPKFNLISCPTCGRTKLDLEKIALETEERLSRLVTGRPVTVAVMGCAVNGPGEAKEADYGIAGGDGKGIIFAKGEIVATCEEEGLVDLLMDIIKKGETE